MSPIISEDKWRDRQSHCEIVLIVARHAAEKAPFVLLAVVLVPALAHFYIRRTNKSKVTAAIINRRHSYSF